jgi:hypothetical protein
MTARWLLDHPLDHLLNGYSMAASWLLGHLLNGHSMADWSFAQSPAHGYSMATRWLINDYSMAG